MEENQELLDQMKKEAEDAVQLLAPLVERRREEELKTDGSFLSLLLLSFPPASSFDLTSVSSYSSFDQVSSSSTLSMELCPTSLVAVSVSPTRRNRQRRRRRTQTTSTSRSLFKPSSTTRNSSSPPEGQRPGCWDSTIVLWDRRRGAFEGSREPLRRRRRVN